MDNQLLGPRILSAVEYLSSASRKYCEDAAGKAAEPELTSALRSRPPEWFHREPFYSQEMIFHALGKLAFVVISTAQSDGRSSCRKSGVRRVRVSDRIEHGPFVAIVLVKVRPHADAIVKHFKDLVQRHCRFDPKGGKTSGQAQEFCRGVLWLVNGQRP